jgi:hypothetical protein
MNVATIPPGGVAAAHVHVGFEVLARSDASEWEHIIPFTRPAASGEVA